MNIGVVSMKGGVAKTTTSVHLAACFHKIAPTVLLDGDPTHNAFLWKERGEGKGLSFEIEDVRSALRLSATYTHAVIDTLQRPTDDDLKYLAQSTDLLVVPTYTQPMELDGLKQTIEAFQRLRVEHYKVLFTSCPSWSEREGDELSDLLRRLGVPMFETRIPRLNAFVKAAALGVVVSAVKDPRAERGWEAYTAVGKEILRHANSKQKIRA